MHTDIGSFEQIILSADIGGTNVNLALVGLRDGRFDIIRKGQYKSQEQASCAEALERFLAECAKALPGAKASRCCVSGAGPVKDNYCTLTNVSWDIDGAELSRALGIPVAVINDFLAISYGIALLDLEDSSQIAKIPHSDGSLPAPAVESQAGKSGVVRAVVGAGTGLGVGYLVQKPEGYTAFPAEGGHSLLPVFDEDSAAYAAWLRGTYGEAPGAELAVSGQGVAQYYKYLRATGQAKDSPALAAIDALADADKPAAISKASAGDPACARTMERFVDFYASFAANAALFYYPHGGLYLAGGIVTKEADRFLAGHRFARAFERNYKENIAQLLKGVPLYIVKDYSISLYGAAQAAMSLL
jgi:glucokinase